MVQLKVLSARERSTLPGQAAAASGIGCVQKVNDRVLYRFIGCEREVVGSLHFKIRGISKGSGQTRTSAQHLVIVATDHENRPLPYTS